jgi:hypothetical protein
LIEKEIRPCGVHFKDKKAMFISTDRRKAEPLPALPLKTKGRKRKLFFALLFEVKHGIFKDDGDADDSFQAKITPNRKQLEGDGERVTVAPRLVSFP